MIAGRWGILVLAGMLASLAPHAPGNDVQSGQNSSPTAPYLSVRGNHLVGRNGNTITLTGVNRSGAEYACAEGWGIWDGPHRYQLGRRGDDRLAYQCRPHSA